MTNSCKSNRSVGREPPDSKHVDRKRSFAINRESLFVNANLPTFETPSRAVAPEGSLNIKRRNGSAIQQSAEISWEYLTANQRMRIRVAWFMQIIYVEIFLVALMTVYGGIVFYQLTLEKDDIQKIQDEMNIIDIAFGSVLLVEISLKLYAYGCVYLKSYWNIFDAIVVVLSFVLVIVAVVGVKSSIFTRLLRLRIVLRLFRVLVVFERVKQRSRLVTNLRIKPGIESPVEHVLRILVDLQHNQGLHPKTRSDIDYIIDIIKSNRLYDTGGEILENVAMDKDTQNWLQSEVLKQKDTSKILPDLVESNKELDTIRSSLSKKSLRRGATVQDLLPLDNKQVKALNKVLEKINDWNFDIFEADAITHGNSLTQVGFFLLNGISDQILQIPHSTVVDFLMEVQKGYKSTNPYHNSIHAADVMQTVHYFISKRSIDQYLTPIDRIVALVAAAVHDYKHDGFNNGFHIASQSKLAVLYNDSSVLENFHVAQTFELMKDPKFNLFKNLPVEDFKFARELMIQMILGTDMAKHFEDVALFKTNILSNDPPEILEIRSVGDKRLLLKLVLHTSDVSNPAKEHSTMLRWTDRVIEEFCQQGDKEKSLSLPISPFMDRETIVLKKMQVGFANFVVAPLFELWAQVLDDIDTDGLYKVKENQAFWESLDDSFKPIDIKDKIQSAMATDDCSRKLYTISPDPDNVDEY